MLGFFLLLYYVQHSCCKIKQLSVAIQEEKEKSNSTKKMRTNKKQASVEPVLGSIQATDEITLGFACYVPEHPQYALLFYHGGGAHGLAGYGYMAEQLATKYNIATYLFDMRGHGRSGGPRGDAPHSYTLWKDVDTAFSFVENEHPHIPIFIGGHSSGAGMLINYALWSHEKQPAGYLFVAPMLGRYAHTNRDHIQKPTNKRPFAEINSFALLLHQITGGLLAGGWRAVHFNYSDDLINNFGFVSDYTVNMAQAMHPNDPYRSLSRIKVPAYIFVADEDELFDPVKMDRFLSPITKINPHLHMVHIKDAYHLAILGDVHDYIGKAITG